MSMCRVFFCIVGRGCLLWPVCSLGKTLLAFALLHSVLQGQICLFLQVSLDFLLFHSSPLWWKGHLFGVLVLKGLVSLHRTIQLQLLQHYWLGHRLGLLWYWIIRLGNEQRSFCRFLDCIQKVKVKVKSLSRTQLLATPAHQAPLSMGFSRQEYWSGVPLPSLLGPWIKTNWKWSNRRWQEWMSTF